MPDLPDRPAPPQPLLDRARTWLVWVGVGRIAVSSVAVLAVLAGAYWLVRPPAATTESTLPYAAGAGSSSTEPAGTSLAVLPPSTSASVAPTELVVHVAGAVTRPGVYRLTPGARVIDAVELAGGLTGDAQPDVVNLAAPVADGERVYVPHAGEAIPVPAGGSRTDAGSPPGPINLNSAGADDLDELPGVGPVTAAAIIAHRDQHGPFSSVDDLADVRGIGPAKVEALRGLVTV